MVKTKPTIALIGNMNNNFFAICRYLRDYGFDARLFLLDEYSHFMPANDSFDEEYKAYTKQTNWHSYYFFDDKLKLEIEKDLEGIDFIIGCHYAPSYLKLINRKLDVFVPYGGDMLYYTFAHVKYGVLKQAYRFVRNLKPLNPLKERANLQRIAILEAGLVIADYFSDESEEVIARNLSEMTRVKASMPMVYDSYSKSPEKAYEECCRIPDIQKILSLKEKGHLLFLSSARHNWVSPTKEDPSKGNDMMVRAFAEYLETNNNAYFILFEYGKDVNATRKLAEELKIDNRIVWVKQMDRKYIMFIMGATDLCIGNVSTSYLTYGVILEAFLMKAPFVHKYKDIVAHSNYNYLYDTFEASDKDSLLAVMKQVKEVKAPAIVKMTEDCYDWYFKEVVENFINIIKLQINKQ